MDGNRKVDGVKLRDGTVVAADFVINATGRRTKAPDWLAEHGVEAPRESYVNAYIGYSTQYVRVPEGVFSDGVMGIGALPWPGETRGVAFFPADNGTHALTAVGAMRDYPSRDRAEVIEFLRSSVCPLAADIAEKAEPVGEINTYHVEGSLLRHWRKVNNLPDRFITVGDAAGSMNPVYGQGMSLSATAGMILVDQFSKADGLDGVARSIHEELGPVLESAFALAGSADASFEGADWSDDYTPPTEADKQHGLAMQVLATQRPEVSYALSMALYNLRPEDLGAPELTAACEEWLKGDRVVPEFDRNKYPATVVPIEENVSLS
jgi:2-polyprenyl-6-methoxyphenol hydroxylase-like FAD-dependent oxidoreductase